MIIVDSETVKKLKDIVGLNRIKVEVYKRAFYFYSDEVYVFGVYALEGVSEKKILEFDVSKPGLLASLFGDTLEKRVIRSAKRAVKELEKQLEETTEINRVKDKLEYALNKDADL